MSKKIEILPEWPGWKRAIAERLNDIGMSMKDASIRAGLGETFVRDALKRDKEPTLRNLDKLRQFLGIDNFPAKVEVAGLVVEGKAQAGAFMDVSLIDHEDDSEKPRINVARDPRYPHASQYALLVIGDSMNKLFDAGSYVTCVSWPDTGLAIAPNMCLHVERHQGSLVEITVKRVGLLDGKFVLEPVSTNQAHKNIDLDGDDGTEIIVRGLITGSWKPISF